MRFCFIVLLILVGLLAVQPALAQKVPLPSCPPRLGPGPTPLPGAPAGPSDLHFAGGFIIWTDNADNEDGYLICIDLGSIDAIAHFEFALGADVTSFLVPPEALICPDWDFGHDVVYAFNDQGLGGAAGTAVLVDSLPVTTLTATVTATATSAPLATGVAPRSTSVAPTSTSVAMIAPAALPATGAAGDSGSQRPPLWPMFAATFALLTAVAALGASYARR